MNRSVRKSLFFCLSAVFLFAVSCESILGINKENFPDPDSFEVIDMQRDDVTFEDTAEESADDETEEGEIRQVILGNSIDTDFFGTADDTLIKADDENYCEGEELWTYTYPVNSISNAIVMKWDLSPVPARAQVLSATLYLYLCRLVDGGVDEFYDITVHRIMNYNPIICYCTGYTYDGVHPWTPYSGLAYDCPLAQSDIAPAEDTRSIDTVYEYKEWTVTEMVRSWVSGTEPNYGVLVNSDPIATADAHRVFCSSEHTEQARRPKLVIVYRQ